MKQFDWKYLVFIALAIPVVNQLADYLGKSATENINQTEILDHPPSPPNQEIRAIVSIEDAEGVTQKNFNIDFLKKLEAYTVERVKKKIHELPNSPQIDITSEAIYVESGQMKLAVIRLRGSDSSNHIAVLGIIGKELKRVTCVRNSVETIPVSYGACAEKIKEAFGIKIGS